MNEDSAFIVAIFALFLAIIIGFTAWRVDTRIENRIDNLEISFCQSLDTENARLKCELELER